MIAQKLDTACTIETPEGVRLELYPAGPVARGGAWLVDSLIRTGIYIALALFLGVMGATGTGILLVSFFLLEWFYPVYFELTGGSTPGKSAFGLVVLHSNGTPVGWQASMIRNLLRTVDFLLLFYGFGLVSMLLSMRFQKLGDMAPGTLASLQNRRALVILITNTRNEDESDLLAATNQLRHRHLVVLADLREEILDKTVTSPIDTESQALRYHAVERYLDERRRKHRLLLHRGIRALDITARQLPVALVNQYLDIKAEASL